MKQAPKRRSGPVPSAKSLLGLLRLVAACVLLSACGQAAPAESSRAAALEAISKEEYTVQVATDYAADHDLARAERLLADLKVPSIKLWVQYMVDSSIAAGREADEIDALVDLAGALGVSSPQMALRLAPQVALATAAPLPSDTPRPTATPSPTPLPPTDTPTPVPPTETFTPLPTDTATPTVTPVPPTQTPRPTVKPTLKPTAKPTAKPKPTATPTRRPAAQWTWTARLVGPGEDGQGCDYGNLMIRVTVVDANGGQIGGVWLYDRYSQQYMVTGNVGSPDWGPGETKFEYGKWGGGSLCIASGPGGPCVTEFTRDMPCFAGPPLPDLHGAGYCDKCCESGSSPDRCQQLITEGRCPGLVFGHFTWRVVYKRNW